MEGSQYDNRLMKDRQNELIAGLLDDVGAVIKASKGNGATI